MKKTIKIFGMLLLTCMLTGISYVASADDEEGFDEVPIDGGVSLLIAAGAAYGAKKLYHVKKKQQPSDTEL